MQSVCIGIWSWFGGSWSGIKRKKWKKWKKWQKELKNYVFLISHEHAENSHSRAKWTKREFGYSLKGKSENWFRMTMRKFRSHAKCSRKTKMVLMNFPLRTIVRNCWSSCEITFFFSNFLVKKPPKDLLGDAKCSLDLDL